jgi:hypothetical protein
MSFVTQAGYMASQANEQSLSNLDEINLLKDSKLNRSELPSTLYFYPTTDVSDIGLNVEGTTIPYNALSTTPGTETIIPSGFISGQDQLLAAFLSEANTIEESIGVIVPELTGYIQKVGGENATFYYKVIVMKADNSVVTLATSTSTEEIVATSFLQFTQSVRISNYTYEVGDRTGLLFYGNKAGSGSDAEYNFRLGGANPISLKYPVPATSVALTPSTVMSKLLENSDTNIVTDLEKAEVTKLVEDKQGARDNLEVETTSQLNVRDADNRNRTNHTGTQTLSTISDAGTLASKSIVNTADIADGEITEAKLASTIIDKLNYSVPSNSNGNGAPTATDDSTQGWVIGSFWIDKSVEPNEVYRAVDATEGSAVWIKLSFTNDELGSMAVQDSTNITATGGSLVNVSVDGRNVGTDGVKLDGIEEGATADQIASEVPFDNTASGLTATDVKGAIDEVDSRLDTAESKLSGIEEGATADLTGAEIKALYEAEPNTNAFTTELKNRVEANVAYTRLNKQASVTGLTADGSITLAGTPVNGSQNKITGWVIYTNESGSVALDDTLVEFEHVGSNVIRMIPADLTVIQSKFSEYVGKKVFIGNDLEIAV